MMLKQVQHDKDKIQDKVQKKYYDNSNSKSFKSAY
jgi:hypothetical protein